MSWAKFVRLKNFSNLKWHQIFSKVKKWISSQIWDWDKLVVYQSDTKLQLDQIRRTNIEFKGEKIDHECVDEKWCEKMIMSN